jgi:hypothetical protein
MCIDPIKVPKNIKQNLSALNEKIDKNPQSYLDILTVFH